MPVSESQERGLALAAVVLDEDELAAAVKRTLLSNLAAKALCRIYGPKDGCHCSGIDERCHAHVLWQEEGRVVVLAFEQAGVLK